MVQVAAGSGPGAPEPSVHGLLPGGEAWWPCLPVLEQLSVCVHRGGLKTLKGMPGRGFCVQHSRQVKRANVCFIEEDVICVF